MSDPDVSAAKAWIEQCLRERGVEEPRAHLTKRGWVVKSGRNTLGRPTLDEVEGRDESAIDRLLELPGAVTVEFRPKDVGDDAWVLWAATDALCEAQQAVVLALMSGEAERLGVNPATHAYRVGSEGARAWQEKQAKAKNGKSGYYPSGAVLAFATKQATDKFRDWFRTKRFEQSPPWFKSRSVGLPIGSFGLETRGRELFVWFKLQEAQSPEGGGRKVAPMVVVKANARGGSGWADVRRLLKGEFRARAARLTWDADARKWLLRVSVGKPRPQRVETSGYIVVVPSLRSFVRIYSDDARGLGRLDADVERASLVARMKQIDARKAKVRAQIPHAGMGSRGHGRKRRFRALRALSGTWENCTKTWAEQQAAFVARVARERGASVIVDDFSAPRHVHPERRVQAILNRFPAAKFRDAVLWACRKAGIPATAVRVERHRTCPACDTERALDVHNEDVRCSHCGAEGDAGFFRAWRALVVAVPDSSESVNAAYMGALEDLARIRATMKEMSDAAE